MPLNLPDIGSLPLSGANDAGGGDGTISRYKKYRSERALREAVEAYFDSISRVREVTEAYNTGEKDKWGHFIMELRPVKNEKGEIMTEREYVIPPTVGGLCAYLRISRETWATYCNREQNPQFAEITAWAREQLLSWREKELMTRPGKDVKGLLFDLQVNYGVGGKSERAASVEREDDPLTRSIKGAIRDGIL